MFKVNNKMFFCEFCEIFKNLYFKEHLRTSASASVLKNSCSGKFHVKLPRKYAFFFFFFEKLSAANLGIMRNFSEQQFVKQCWRVT